MRLGAFLLSVALAGIAACTGGESRGSAADDSFTLPSDGKDGPSAPPAGLTLRGVLSFDDLEGGCAFLETPDGRRYEVVYPDGWTLDRRSGGLTGPDGRQLPPGTTIEVAGRIASDRSSICQVGPIVVASGVEIPEP